MKFGITFKGAPGIGDILQFTSVPENFHAHTGLKLVDVDKSWVFDHNPFVLRDVQADQVLDIWRFDWTKVKGDRHAYTCLAERNAVPFSRVPRLSHPRLYTCEESLVAGRVIVHTTGSPGIHTWRGYDHEMKMNQAVMDHIVKKYNTHDWDLVQVGAETDLPLGGGRDLRGKTKSIWELVKVIASAQIFIGVDSGPSWIAACYPHIFNKKVLMQAPADFLDHYIPMQINDGSTHWHDSCFKYYNRFEYDAGMTLSYLKL